jgi:hypothetical protein
MITLQIEHPVTAYETWRAAFDRFADIRRQSGVLAERVAHPLGSDGVIDTHIVIGLDFADLGRAQAFLGFLRTSVWSSASSSPALAGEPVVRLLESAPAGS